MWRHDFSSNKLFVRDASPEFVQLRWRVHYYDERHKNWYNTKRISPGLNSLLLFSFSFKALLLHTNIYKKELNGASRLYYSKANSCSPILSCQISLSFLDSQQDNTQHLTSALWRLCCRLEWTVCNLVLHWILWVPVPGIRLNDFYFPQNAVIVFKDLYPPKVSICQRHWQLN